MTEYADHLHEHMKYPVCINKGSYQATQVSLTLKHCSVYLSVYKNTQSKQLTLLNPVYISYANIVQINNILGSPWKILDPPLELIVAEKKQRNSC